MGLNELSDRGAAIEVTFYDTDYDEEEGDPNEESRDDFLMLFVGPNPAAIMQVQRDLLVEDVVNLMERHFEGAELGGVVAEIDKLFSDRFDALVSSLEIGKPRVAPVAVVAAAAAAAMAAGGVRATCIDRLKLPSLCSRRILIAWSCRMALFPESAAASRCAQARSVWLGDVRLRQLGLHHGRDHRGVRRVLRGRIGQGCSLGRLGLDRVAQHLVCDRHVHHAGHRRMGRPARCKEAAADGSPPLAACSARRRWRSRRAWPARRAALRWQCSSVVVSNTFYSYGESLTGAFLPELATADGMGKVSGWGWGFGYVGGMLALGICLAYVLWSQAQGLSAAHFVPVTMLITACIYGAAACATFALLPERAHAAGIARRGQRVAVSCASHFQRGARATATSCGCWLAPSCYQGGVAVAITLAAIYAEQVIGFVPHETMMLIFVLNVAAALGAFCFGYVQDRMWPSSVAWPATLVAWIVVCIDGRHCNQQGAVLVGRDHCRPGDGFEPVSRPRNGRCTGAAAATGRVLRTLELRDAAGEHHRSAGVRTGHLGHWRQSAYRHFGHHRSVRGRHRAAHAHRHAARPQGRAAQLIRTGCRSSAASRCRPVTSSSPCSSRSRQSSRCRSASGRPAASGRRRAHRTAWES
jgi:hypothetical protein